LARFDRIAQNTWRGFIAAIRIACMYFSFKNLTIILAAILVCGSTLEAQTSATSASSTTVTTPANQPQPIRVEGIVVDQKKYSIKVKSGDKEYSVSLANGAAIGLKMNKPWYDWKNDQVVVDAVPFPAASDDVAKKRVPIKFPAKDLYLISRFADRATLNDVMSKNVKRLNFYLVTPEDQGQHMPTEKEPYISGKLNVDKKDLKLKVDDSSLLIRLGFRFATMNGFSINELKPQTTQVFLSGVEGKNPGEIVASRILFQPIERKSESK
jgi:hypothetical protein